MCWGPFPSAKDSLGDCRRDSAAGQKLTGPPDRQIIWSLDHSTHALRKQIATRHKLRYPKDLMYLMAASYQPLRWCSQRTFEVQWALRFWWSCSVCWTGQRSWTFPGPLPISVCCRIAPCRDKDIMCVEGRYGKRNRRKSLFGKTSPGMIAIIVRLYTFCWFLLNILVHRIFRSIYIYDHICMYFYSSLGFYRGSSGSSDASIFSCLPKSAVHQRCRCTHSIRTMFAPDGRFTHIKFVVTCWQRPMFHNMFP